MLGKKSPAVGLQALPYHLGTHPQLHVLVVIHLFLLDSQLILITLSQVLLPLVRLEFLQLQLRVELQDAVFLFLKSLPGLTLFLHHCDSHLVLPLLYRSLQLRDSLVLLRQSYTAFRILLRRYIVQHNPET